MLVALVVVVVVVAPTATATVFAFLLLVIWLQGEGERGTHTPRCVGAWERKERSQKAGCEVPSFSCTLGDHSVVMN